ncbi:MAG: extracellular solute-binding protein [Streptosporangiaceae bacterium]|nr:extracellular solute-binding protein [Streptosporangiaceae bacterium]
MNALSRRRFLSASAKTAAAAAIAGPVIAGCSTSSSSGASSVTSKGDDVLTLGFPGTPKTFTSTQKLLSKFTKQTGITVNFFTTNTSSNTWVSVFQEISTRLAGGQPMDSANIATEGMLLFAKQGLLEPLDDYIAKDQAFMTSFYNDIDQQMLAAFRQLDNVDGKTYFVPYVYNVMSMWYNPSLFKAHNLPAPAPGWTWDDFERAATTIASAPNRYGYAISTPVPGPFIDVYPWVLTNGGQIMNTAQTQCVSDNAAAIEAAAFVRNLVVKQAANPPGGTYNQFTAMAAGNLGMFGGGVWPNNSIPLTQSQINSQVAIAPWPKHGADGTPVGLAAFPMFKSTANKKALWEFIKFSVSPDFQAADVGIFSGGMPIRKSSATTYAATLPPGTDNFISELPNSTMIVGVPNGSAVENQMSTVWEQILTGAVSPAAGMKAMQDSCNQLMTQKV